MLCRFENHLTHQALGFYDYDSRIDVYHPSELEACFEHIQQALNKQQWVALILEYELGEWWQLNSSVQRSHTPRVTALIYNQAKKEPCWDRATLPIKASPLQANQAYADYIQTINDIKQRIRQGEFYQINYTQAFHLKTDSDPEQLFRHVNHQHPVAYAALIEDPLQQRHILSFSPELFLRKTGSTLVTRPMKGTAPRHADPIQDERNAKALQTSQKDRSENLMIVDLLRNDLSKIAKIGSVETTQLFSLEQYPSVWTLTSEIQAEIPSTISLLDTLRALFPCGSITGAPKRAAMEYIKKHEETPRGIYCGSVGWLAPNGDFCLNVAIRTLVLQQSGNAQFGAGGGIVYDSIADQEWQECFWKTKLLQSLYQS